MDDQYFRRSTVGKCSHGHTQGNNRRKGAQNQIVRFISTSRQQRRYGSDFELSEDKKLIL